MDWRIRVWWIQVKFLNCFLKGMIYLKLNWFFYGLSRMLQFSQFVWALRSSVWDVFNNFLLIDASDRSKISSDQKRFFIALSLYPLSFFANTPFNYAVDNYVKAVSRFSLITFLNNFANLVTTFNKLNLYHIIQNKR